MCKIFLKTCIGNSLERLAASLYPKSLSTSLHCECAIVEGSDMHIQ